MLHLSRWKGMICYTCKQPIQENETYKVESRSKNLYHEKGIKSWRSTRAEHVDVDTGETDCIKPLSKIEQLEKRIKELESTVNMLHHQAEGAALEREGV